MDCKISKTKSRPLTFQTSSRSLKGGLQNKAKDATDTTLSGIPYMQTENISKPYLEQAKQERTGRTATQLEKRIGNTSNKDAK